ncbi:SusC/RagA family TonB-linked outer membrane protein [Flavobacterium frigidarium]|uniref:SusC/RagA family TonB-linked outer membrane protein n=1 Tax=Flavobacterium frigidarium TaxID=99286 RepID=UPI0004062795|nr:SusC/RagA family TonB-linked outer membrane protein [Flavobacterium frigidarium]
MKLKLNQILILLLVLVTQVSFAQEGIVRGIVTDASGMPLPGVSISVKGTTNGAQTDFDGKYTIKASTSQILVFSYIGMKTQERKASSSSINVKLLGDALELEGVTINVFGIETKKKLSNSSSSKVKGEALATTGETGLLNSLSAKASNVVVTSSSGDPGAGSYVQIRGQNTITGNTQPLYVVDGIPISGQELDNGNQVGGVNQQSRVGDINPNSIASVTILKGASASALWGFRAANGVVLITTKKGRGKLSIELNSSYSIDDVNVRFKTQNLFGQGSNGSFVRNTGSSFGDLISSRSGAADDVNTAGSYFVSDRGNTYYGITKKNSTANFNNSNYDEILGTGNTSNQNIAFSGGSENGSFYLSLGNTKQDGVVRNSSYERTNIDFNTVYKLGEKTTFTGKMSYSTSNSNRVQQGSNTSGLLLGLYRTAPDFDNRDFLGTNFTAAGVATVGSHRSYRKDLGTTETSTSPIYNNPFWSTDIQKNPNTVNRYIAGIQLEHQFTDQFRLIGRANVDGYSDDRQSMYPIYSSENGGGGYASEDGVTHRQYNVDVLGIGNFNFTDDLRFEYTAGLNTAEINTVFRGGDYKNFLINSPKFVYSNSLLANRTTYLNRSNTKTNAAFLSTSLNYKDYLNANVGARAETSSALDPNLKTYVYPSVELSYLFTHHLKSEALTFGKIRATYGQVAIMPGIYNGYTYITGATGTESWGPAYDAAAYNGGFERESLAGNPDLKPEIKTQYEAGIDLGFFNRVNLGVTYYTDVIRDNLVAAANNPSSSVSDLYGNFAQLSNKGLEIDFDAAILKNSDFKWNIAATFGTNKNEVTKLTGSESILLNGFAGTSSRAVLNQPLGVLWGGRWDRDDSGELILDSRGFPIAAATEGVIGNPNPKFRAGLTNTFEYKGLSLNVLFDASVGGDLWDGTNGALNVFGKSVETANILNLTAAEATALTGSNGATAISQGWLNSDGSYSVRGNIKDFGAGPRLLNQSWYSALGGGFGAVSEQFIKSATWVKLREATVAYRLPSSSFLEKAGVEAMTFSLTGRNLWLWTEDKTLGQDPETNLTGGSNGRGLQYFNSPNTKSIIFSLNVKF